MRLTATISLDKAQMCECICQFLQSKGIHNVSHQDIQFVVEEVEYGDQKDSWTVHELTEVKIKNVEVGIQ